jgi:hypothetical protein
MDSPSPGLQLVEDLVILGKNSIRADSIKSIKLLRWNYFRRNSLFGIIPVRVIELILLLQDSKTFTYVLDEGRIPEGVAFSKDDFDGFEEQYASLLERTFQGRLASFYLEFQRLGYFTIENISFYPMQKIAFKRRTIPAKNVAIIHQDRNLWIRNRVPSPMNFFNHRISLDKDPDVLLALMDIFKNGWKK